MNTFRKPTTLLIALGAALAMPLAFAQETPTDATTQDPATMQQTPPTGTPEAAPAQPAEGQVTWADLDSDGNGNLSQDEASAHSALAGVFAQADTDADGELTPDEYRNFAASQAGGAAGGASGE